MVETCVTVKELLEVYGQVNELKNVELDDRECGGELVYFTYSR